MNSYIIAQISLSLTESLTGNSWSNFSMLFSVQKWVEPDSYQVLNLHNET